MFTIRNDDVAFDTNLAEIKKFCEVCDKHGIKIIQAITPIGECRKIKVTMTNEDIRLTSFRRFEENNEVVEFLKNRQDAIGIHGLWHTHMPTIPEIIRAKTMLQEMGFNPSYYVPPFNEGSYPEKIAGLITCQLAIERGERLEDFIKRGNPRAPIMYLHSWRFDNAHYTFEQLDQCLERIKS